jgi:hypothetical protein
MIFVTASIPLSRYVRQFSCNRTPLRSQRDWLLVTRDVKHVKAREIHIVLYSDITLFTYSTLCFSFSENASI